MGSAAPMLIGLLVLPYLLKELGVGRLGVLTLIWTLIGYFSIFDFGLGRALTHRISALRADHQAAQIYSVTYFGLACMLGIGLVGATLEMVSIFSFGVGWLNLDPDIYSEVYWAIILSGIGIPLATATSGMKGVLEGFESFKSVNILRAILGVSNFLLPAFTVKFFGPNLSFIVIGLLIARFVVMLLHWYAMQQVIIKPLNYRFHIADGSRGLIHFGAWMTLSNIVSPLMAVADRFIISHFDGSASVAYYAVPFDFMFRLLMLPAALTTTLFPIFSRELKSNIEKVKGHFIQSQLLIGVVMSLICGLLAIFSHYGLSVWMGSDFAEHSYRIAIIIAIGIIFNSLGQAPLMLIQAAGRVKLTSIIHLCEFAIYAPALVIAVKYYGVMGAALVWLVRVLVDCSILNIYGFKIIANKNAQ